MDFLLHFDFDTIDIDSKVRRWYNRLKTGLACSDKAVAELARQDILALSNYIIEHHNQRIPYAKRSGDRVGQNFGQETFLHVLEIAVTILKNAGAILQAWRFCTGRVTGEWFPALAFAFREHHLTHELPG